MAATSMPGRVQMTMMTKGSSRTNVDASADDISHQPVAPCLVYESRGSSNKNISWPMKTLDTNSVRPIAPVKDLEKGTALTTIDAKSSSSSFGGKIATQAELTRFEKDNPLAAKLYQEHGHLRQLRWGYFSMYRKIFVLVFLLNIIGTIIFLTQINNNSNAIFSYQNAATAASVNFCVSVLIRNEHVINSLFQIALTLPVSSPLIIRGYAAKVYSYGGLHSACGVCGTLWYIVFCGVLVTHFALGQLAESALAFTTALTLVFLLCILVMAHPYLRSKMHNSFETSHRYCGWCAIAILWAQTMVLVSTGANAEHKSFGSVLIITPPFWCLVIITCCLIYPWLRLRNRKVRAEVLSKHAVRLHFDYATLGSCMAVRLTDTPLKETHAFATIPNRNGAQGFSVIVSNAGDWTKKMINNPPSHIQVKGAPTIGVMRVALLFKRVLVVATGSGIGPCMSMFSAYPDYPMRVLWSSRTPRQTYGESIMQSVYAADRNAVIVDTKQIGRGNMLALAYAIFRESDCEAAIVISNAAVTKEIVYGFESRGVPAYGPIFDS